MLQRCYKMLEDATNHNVLTFNTINAMLQNAHIATRKKVA